MEPSSTTPSQGVHGVYALTQQLGVVQSHRTSLSTGGTSTYTPVWGGSIIGLTTFTKGTWNMALWGGKCPTHLLPFVKV